VGVHPVGGEIDQRPLWRQPRLGVADLTDGQPHRDLEGRADLLEVIRVGNDIRPADPLTGAIGPPDGSAGNRARRRLLPPLGQVQGCVRVVPAAEQQHLPVEPVDRSKRGALAQRVRQPMLPGDRSGMSAEGRERHLRMIAAHGARPGADGFGDDAHPPARGATPVEPGRLRADRRPPRLGDRRIAPVGRIGVVGRVGRHHESARRPEDVKQRLHDRLSPARHEAKAAGR
jgi:hypothetical protein